MKTKNRLKKLLSTMLALSMVFSMFAAFPIKASAATPVTINLSTLGSSDIARSGNWNDSEWRYTAVGRRLELLTNSGDYTLTGTNTNLYVAARGTVTLWNAHITRSGGGYAFETIRGNYTINLIGTNSITNTVLSTYNSPYGRYLAAINAGPSDAENNNPFSLTITSSTGGSLTATGGTCGISVGPKVSLHITGNANVIAQTTTTSTSYSATAINFDNFGVGASDASTSARVSRLQVGPSARLTATGLQHGVWSRNTNSTLVLDCDGEAVFRATASNGAGARMSSNLQISGTGSVRAIGGYYGIETNNFQIENCHVIAEGTSTTSPRGQAILMGPGGGYYNNPIRMNNNAKLTMINRLTWSENQNFQEYNAGSTHQWKLTNATTANPLTNATIAVSVPGGSTGIVERTIRTTTVPGAPTGVSATPGDGRVTLNWTAPSSNGGSVILRYEVSRDNGVNWVNVSSNTSHTFTGLTNGTSYTFRVRAVNSVGNGAAASVSATPVGGTATPPGTNPPGTTPGSNQPWKPPSSTNRFNDVPNGNWQNAAVSWADSNGITTGSPAGSSTFKPDDTITRAEFITFLHRIYSTPSAPRATFRDMPTNPAFQNAISWASTVGITTGSPAGSSTFMPGDNITREQIAAMLYRYVGGGMPAPVNRLGSYTDQNSISTWVGARDAVNWAVYHEIMGQNVTTLNPRGNATRAEAVTMLYRVVEKFNIPAP